jgi:hypothetical protein
MECLITDAALVEKSLRRMRYMYSPKISEELVKKLYQLKQQNRKPMTSMVNEAVIEYLIKCEEKDGKARLRKVSY